MVTVIIPTFKRARFIERAVESVVNQTYKDIEIIVVDDNNPDSDDRKEMEYKMEKYKNIPNFKYIKHEKNKNGAAARNTGLKVAKGEYVTFLDDDDYFAKERIEKLVKFLDKNKQYQIAYTGGIIYKDEEHIKTFKIKENIDYKKELLLNHSFIGTGSNMFFKTKNLIEIGGFDERFIRNQDLEVLIRFLNKNNIIGLNEPLVVKDNTDRINQPNVENLLKTREFFLNNFENLIDEYKDSNSIYFENYFNLLLYAISCNNKKYEKILKEKAEKYQKIYIKNYLILLKNKYFKKIKKGKKNIKLKLEEEKLLQEFIKNTKGN